MPGWPFQVSWSLACMSPSRRQGDGQAAVCSRMEAEAAQDGVEKNPERQGGENGSPMNGCSGLFMCWALLSSPYTH